MNQHGLVALHESARRQVKDLLTIDRWVKREIETFQSLAEINGGATRAQLQLFLCAAFNFLLDEALEKVDVREFFRDRLLRADLQRGEDAGQPQVFSFGTS